MIVVHHLENSRSQRILWLLEELSLPYEIKRYKRDPKTRYALPGLEKVHPLGKSPVITDGPITMIESGAIIDYIIRRHGDGRLQPRSDTRAYDEYVQWMHYAEGSAMLPLLLHFYMSRLGGDASAPLRPRIDAEIANHLGYIDNALAGRTYVLGDEFSGADVQMSYVGERAGFYGVGAPYANLAAWVKRLQARPAYQKALEKGGG
jgi:glutathione S-transferase